MTFLVPIALCVWVVVAIGLFAVLPPRRAVLTAYLMAWLFLPNGGIGFAGFPDLDKITASSLGVILGVMIFDAGRLVNYRPSWVDLPILIWCLSPLPSSLVNALPSNELGWYDGLSGVFGELFTWGIPYLVGRLYFNDLQSLRDLAIGIFIGGLIYVPLCAWEIRMSPQLHRMVYGYHPSFFGMTMRFGGYRPMVFMQHGLMVGMWMTCASLVGVWLWATGALRHIARVPMTTAVPILLIITILCKSTGAIILLAGGVGVLFMNRFVRSTVVMVAVIAVAPIYMVARTQGLWSGGGLIGFAEMIHHERADSLAGRLENEDLLIVKAQEKPLLGWGGWGRWRIFDEQGRDITISDGMWVIARGTRGLIGLCSMTAVVLLPILLLLRRVPARNWSTPATGPPAALAVILLLYSIDNLFNAMLNPIYLLAAGGLSGLYVAYPQLQRIARTAQRQVMQRVQTAALARPQPAPVGPSA